MNVQGNSSQVSHRPWSNRLLRLVILLSVLAAVVALAGLEAPRPAQAQTSWNLVWSDEFNGTSVNTSNWTFETGGGGWGNNELEYYTNGQNATVSGGILTIEARRESGGFNCWNGPCQWTSSRMNTKGKREFQYGKIEARLAVPSGQGLWPAFWALGANFPGTPWPNCGEIDIMEHINTQTTTYGTIHWDAGGYATYGGSTGVATPTAFHTYAIEWNSSSIKWFLDGTQFWEANILNNINSTEEFHRPFFLILNLAVGGNWPGSPNSGTPSPARYQIDYVRVYQAGGGGPTPTTPPAPSPTPGGGTTFTQGVVNVNASQARPWFKPNGWTAGYVILHYIRPGLSQQNINMSYSSANARWEYTVGGMSSGQVLQYQFTYQRNGLQYDTAWYSWTKP